MPLEPAAPTPIEAPPDFPVRWESPEEAMLLWEWEQQHIPLPYSPLSMDVVPPAIANGITTVLRAAGAPLLEVRNKRINTFLYMANVPDPERLTAMKGPPPEPSQPPGADTYRRWLNEYLPEIKAMTGRLRGFDYAGASDSELLAHVEWALEALRRAWVIHFKALFPTGPAMDMFRRLCAEELDMSSLEAYELLRGLPNLSVESASRLWRLAREAPPAALEIIESLPAGEAYARLESTSETRPFIDALKEYLEEFGWRSGSFDLKDPLWVEQPWLALDHVRLALKAPRDPADDQQEQARQSAAAREAGRKRLAEDPATLARFDQLYSIVRHCPVVQEDHNFHIDTKLVGMLRLPFLEVGRRMARAGVVGHEEDVHYLELEEALDFLRGDRQPRDAEAAERRAEMDRWRGFTPPQRLGALPPPHMIPESDFAGARVEPSNDPKVVEGLAGARGTARGTARVVRSLAEAGRVQEGDILVCDMTTPAWTPLFGSLAGIVADSGGALSHCAIVAREYGLPCVVGTRVGTQRIPDGATITVDGELGLVTIES